MKRQRSTKAVTALRVSDLLPLRLDGLKAKAIQAYVREKEIESGSAWFLSEGEAPISCAQIARYLSRADKMILEAEEDRRKRQVRRKLSKPPATVESAKDDPEWQMFLKGFQQGYAAGFSLRSRPMNKTLLKLFLESKKLEYSERPGDVCDGEEGQDD